MEKYLNITEYIKSLQYRFRLNKAKATLLEMKNNLRQLRRDA